MIRAFCLWLLLCVSALAADPASVCVVRTPGGQGTGWLLEHDGMRVVVTNHHVVRIGDNPESARHYASCEVIFPSAGKRYRLNVIGGNVNCDVSVMDARQVEGLEPFELGDDMAGGTAEVYGFGHGQFGAMETSFKPHEFDRHPIYELRYPVRSGDSGSPVVCRGRVIGLVFGVYTDESAGLATRCEPIKAVLRSVKRIFTPTQWGQRWPSCQGPACGQGGGGGMRVIQQPPPQARPLTPVTATPAPSQTCEGCEKCDALTAKVADLESRCEQLNNDLGTLTEATTEGFAEVNMSVIGMATHFSDVNNRFKEINATLGELKGSCAEASGYADRIADLDDRLRAEEERTVTLEIQKDGEVVGQSTGRRIVRFDVETLNGG